MYLHHFDFLNCFSNRPWRAQIGNKHCRYIWRTGTSFSTFNSASSRGKFSWV